MPSARSIDRAQIEDCRNGRIAFFPVRADFHTPSYFHHSLSTLGFLFLLHGIGGYAQGAGMPMAENLLRHLAQARFVRPESNIAPTITSETLRDSFEDADAALALIRRKALVPPAATGPLKVVLGTGTSGPGTLPRFFKPLIPQSGTSTVALSGTEDFAWDGSRPSANHCDCSAIAANGNTGICSTNKSVPLYAAVFNIDGASGSYTLKADYTAGDPSVMFSSMLSAHDQTGNGTKLDLESAGFNDGSRSDPQFAAHTTIRF